MRKNVVSNEGQGVLAGSFCQTECVGVFFYVLPEAVEAAHRIMREHGYRPHEGKRAPDDDAG